MSSGVNTRAADLLGGGVPSADHIPPPALPLKPQARRGWFSQVLYQTFGRIGARAGSCWIALVAFCAIFAPVLANSFPLVVKIDGHWSSPMLRYFSPADVTLLVAAATGLILWLLKSISGQTRWLIFFAVTAAALILSIVFIRTPLVNSYEAYRELRKTDLATGQHHIQFILNALVPYSPNDHLNDQFDENNPQPWKPSWQHPLGTEENGEDMLSVMIHACRIAMSIGVISTGIAVLIGILVGGLMGYFAGVVDLLGMRLVEIFGAIPTIYLLLAFCAAFDRNIYLVMGIIGLTGWTTDARFVRAEFLKLRNQDFVHGAIAAGLPLRSVLFKHILPNALAPLLVSASFGVASAILSEAVLSFLGLGLPVDAASWGRLLNEGVGGTFHWWLATFPGLAIFLTVFSYNLIGEAFRDALDPKLSPQ